MDARRPAALLDQTWPAATRAHAERCLRLAQADGRVGAGDIVVFSSGSTDRPRGVVRSQESWLGSVDSLTDQIGVAGGATGLLGPVASSLYLFAAVHAHATGRSLVLTDEWDGSPLADQVSVLHATPLAALRRQWPSQLAALVVAGDRVPPELRQRCLQRGVRLVEYYGSVEASFVLIGEHGLSPFPGVQVRLDEQRRLWSRSPYQFTRYLEDSGPAELADGWITVGDLAEELPTGRLRLLGRLGSITSGGHTIQLADVEAALARLDGVRAVVAVGLPHPVLGGMVGVVVETDLPAESLHDVVQSLPAPSRPRRSQVTAALPRLASGKPDRLAAARLLLDHSLPVHDPR